MNALRNIPIMLRHNGDGTVIAECLLLPGCKCFGHTRTQALETMQTMVRSALRAGQAIDQVDYEIVHLAIRPAPVSTEA